MKWVSIDYKAYYFYTINLSVNSASIPVSNKWSGRSYLITLFLSDTEFIDSCLSVKHHKHSELKTVLNVTAVLRISVRINYFHYFLPPFLHFSDC